MRSWPCAAATTRARSSTRIPSCERVIETIARLNGDVYRPIVDALTGGDRYFLCADFAPYVEAQERAARSVAGARGMDAHVDPQRRARSGWFSADRTVLEYAREIWNVDPVSVTLEEEKGPGRPPLPLGREPGGEAPLHRRGLAGPFGPPVNTLGWGSTPPNTCGQGGARFGIGPLSPRC